MMTNQDQRATQAFEYALTAFEQLREAGSNGDLPLEPRLKIIGVLHFLKQLKEFQLLEALRILLGREWNTASAGPCKPEVFAAHLSGPTNARPLPLVDAADWLMFMRLQTRQAKQRVDRLAELVAYAGDDVDWLSESDQSYRFLARTRVQ